MWTGRKALKDRWLTTIFQAAGKTAVNNNILEEPMFQVLVSSMPWIITWILVVQILVAVMPWIIYWILTVAGL